MDHLPRLRLLVPALVAVAALPGMAAEATPAPTGTTRTPPVAIAGGNQTAGEQGAGAGAAAGQAIGATVDRVLRTMKWGAYGELHYNNFQGADSHTGSGANHTGRDMLELHRIVLLAEAQLADQWRFVTELEIEHAFVQGNNANGAGEVEVEQAYLDYQFAEHHGARAGMLLVPISIGNLYHEPTLFHGVERPEFDRVIVPTTWFESGIQAYGRVVENLDYTVSVHAGYAGSSSASAPSQGVRGWRQRGFKSAADDMLYVARLDWRPLTGLWLAGAYSHGEINQSDEIAAPDATVQLYTLEARYANAGWDLGLSLGQGRISDADQFAQVTTGANQGAVPEVFTGISGTVAYDVLRLVTDTSHQLYLFGRYEWLQNQDEVPGNRTANQAWNADIYQYGITYKPNPYVAIKADYRDYENDSETAVDSWNLGVGFAF
jgi:hypothetical protein